jgi:hypothetical protein
MFVCCECYVLSGRGLCDQLITRPEESYRMWRVVVCYLETSRMRRPWPFVGPQRYRKKICVYKYLVNLLHIKVLCLYNNGWMYIHSYVVI